MLIIKNLSKTFKGQVILEDINLVVQKMSIVGLAGPSGSGKSTLLRCIQKLDTPDFGNIECDQKKGFMFQDFQLFPHMTVLKNLTYAPTIQDKSKDHTSRALKLLDQLKIKDKSNVYPHNLSGGQKQRVAMARSLMMNPQILLCDEPTSGLDVSTILDVITLLQSVRDMGLAMIIASHDLDFLTRIADRIILLRDGKIAIDMKTTSDPDPITLLKKFY